MSWLGGTISKSVCYVESLGLPEDEPSWKSKPYKINYVRAKQLQRCLKILVDRGIFKKGMSEWTSPCFLIGKGGGKGCRIIFDYSTNSRGPGLNQKIVEKSFHIRDTSTVLQAIANNRPAILSSVDLSQAYFSVQLGPLAQRQGAIVTDDATLLPTRLPFGFALAPSIFAYALSKILDHCPPCPVTGTTSYKQAYFDDITIFTPVEDRHLHLLHIKSVLGTLGKFCAQRRR
jgi:hypothetical protein